jgi:predicted ABC-type ATPase
VCGQYPLRILARAGERGYSRALIYVGIDDPAECVRRVRRRVADGGHDVPSADVLRRYARSLATLPRAINVVERVTLIDNPVRGAYRVIAQSQPGELDIERSIPGWATTTVNKLARR